MKKHKEKSKQARDTIKQVDNYFRMGKVVVGSLNRDRRVSIKYRIDPFDNGNIW